VALASAQVIKSVLPVEPIAEVQEVISDLAFGVTERKPITDAELEAGVEQLLKISSSNRPSVLEQLLLFHGEQRLKGGGEAGDLGIGLIYRHLEYTDSETLECLYPLFLRADEFWRSRIAGAFFDGIGTSGSVDDFTPFSDYIRTNQATVGPADFLPLYEYLFERSPKRAIQTVRRLGLVSGSSLAMLDSAMPILESRFGPELTRNRRRSEVTEAEARSVLEGLASSSDQWMRILAVSILRRHPSFVPDDTLSRLTHDSNEAVRRMAMDAREKLEEVR
jgi:hypothetical protein